MKYTSTKLLLIGLIGFVMNACSYTLKIKDGPTAFERKQYSVAIPLLESEFSRAKTRTEKAQKSFLIGESYKQMGQYEKAINWYKQAYDNNGGPEALKAWAFGLKILERYAEARDAFKNLGIEIGSPYEYRKEVTACTIAEDWLKQAPTNGWTIENPPFNSPQNDFSPAFYSDGLLAFSSDRSMSKSGKKYYWTGMEFMDIFVTDPNGASPQKFDNQLNTEGNEGTACFNKTGTEMFFVRAIAAYKGDDAICKIFVTEKNEENVWAAPILLPFQKDKINYRHPALSADGNTLYFSCNSPEGWGGYDLYTMARNTKAETGWDEPKLLSRNINSPGNELFPTLDQDTLYFASDGLQGMGGLDIFRTYKSEKNAWSPPHNLKSPINSGSDDFSFIVDKKNAGPVPKEPGALVKSGYFTSNRSGGQGGDDIYRFEQRIPPPKPPQVDTVKTKNIPHKILLEIYVLEKILANPNDPNSKQLGRKPLIGATVSIETGSKKQQKNVQEKGFIELELNENTDYQFKASQEMYLSNTARFSTRGIAKDPNNPVQTFEVEILLDKIYKNQEIVLENIYYDYDKWDIRPDAEPTLNRLSEMLLQNQGVRIQLGSHTDCRGNDAYNQELSQRRAQSAVNYLIGKGIDTERLSAVGYGEKQPSVECICSKCTETEHQTNRRTTFKILE
jgi:peptidoglycan-associated lipoprotein